MGWRKIGIEAQLLVLAVLPAVVLDLAKPDATQAVFHEGWLRTGDMGAMDENGYVYFRDRLKDMVKTGGLNVYSQEVERVLQKHPAVREVAIIGLPSDRWGEEVVAVVVARDGQQIVENELIAFAKQNLASYKAPKRVVVIDYAEMPINYSGKILKRELRRTLVAASAAAGRSLGFRPRR